MKEQGPTSAIKLVNPESHNFPAFMVGNAVSRIDLCLPELFHVAPEAYQALVDTVAGLSELPVGSEEAYKAKIRLIAAFRSVTDTFCTEQFMMEQGSAYGQTVVICGAGPSLRETAPKWVPRGDQVWGCNSALTWLYDNGYPVTHGFTVDQTPAMLVEWESAPDVEYLIASTVHDHLVTYLIDKGRRVRFFNNYVGIKGEPIEWTDRDGNVHWMEFEDGLYQSTFPPTLRAGSGLNATTRAIDAALFMGFKEIIILGADCALRAKKRRPKGAQLGHPDPEMHEAYMRWLREDVEMHANGDNALASGATAVVYDADIDGRYWVTKPDLCITANWLVDMKRKIEARTDVKVRIVGDTFVKAIMNKPESFRDRLINITDADDNVVRFMPDGEGEEVPTSQRQDVA